MTKPTLFDTIRSLTGHGSRLSVERIYCEAMGKDLAGGMFLSQLIFWSDKGKRADGYVYRSAQEWENDTYLSTYLVRKYTKQCEDFGWLETKLMKANGSPTVHYRVDASKFSKWICENLQMESEKFTNLLTDTTTDTTTEGSVVSEPEPAQPQHPADKPTTPPPLARAESSYPSLQDMGKQPTAQERYRARGRSLKYCDDYQPKEHRAIFEAIVDAMGKRSIVDADNGKTIGDLQQAAVTLTRAGQTAQTIEAKAAGWRASFFGLRNGSAQQFMEFVATDTPQAAPQREKSANAINLAYLLENAQ